jgi:ATP-dependent DNA ligase
VHEIKHDGFRVIATRAGEKVKLFSRRGTDFTDRFPAAVAAITAVRARSFVIDGEAIAVDQNGLAVFEFLRGQRHDHVALLCAFDLLELDGEDLRRQPLETRKAALARLLGGAPVGLALGRDRLPARLRARLRGHRIEAQGVALPLRSRIAG